MIQLQISDRALPACALGPSISPLPQLFADIDLAATSPLRSRHRAVAAALPPYLGRPDLLHGVACPCPPDRYVRHLLHAGREHTVLVLVWRPGQMSPVHGHRSWCALGIHSGHMVETLFTPGHLGPRPHGCTSLTVGDVSDGPAGPDAIHRLANLGTATAISIHVYGARYDRLAENLNRVYAA
jgi:3-mercaptopropionate dioxygenase